VVLRLRKRVPCRMVFQARPVNQSPYGATCGFTGSSMHSTMLPQCTHALISCAASSTHRVPANRRRGSCAESMRAATANVLATAPRDAVLRAEVRRLEADFAVRWAGGGSYGWGGVAYGWTNCPRVARVRRVDNSPFGVRGAPPPESDRCAQPSVSELPPRWAWF
jgi:hypothetical protein